MVLEAMYELMFDRQKRQKQRRKAKAKVQQTTIAEQSNLFNLSIYISIQSLGFQFFDLVAQW